MHIRMDLRLIFPWFFLALFLNRCSELREPVPANLEPELSVHPRDWISDGAPEFHGVFLQSSGWDLANCQQCHGVDYSGGIANRSCLTCHPSTPEDCTVCHGGVDNQTGAPPTDLADNFSSGVRGVGAHTPHLSGASFSNGFDCSTCHVVPGTFDAPEHIDSPLPAEVVFSKNALLDEAEPRWNDNSLSCENVYCHGNWSLAKEQSSFAFIYSADSIVGNQASPEWTNPETVTCGTCHDLPPTGHNPFELTACVNCHNLVMDSQGNISDKSKHANGLVNVFGQEFPMF
ncbi:MAG: CxxxxCH/CxxCH domain-containing protein [bacterium]